MCINIYKATHMSNLVKMIHIHTFKIRHFNNLQLFQRVQIRVVHVHTELYLVFGVVGSPPSLSTSVKSHIKHLYHNSPWNVDV